MSSKDKEELIKRVVSITSLLQNFSIDNLPAIKSFETRKSDIWVASYPKSGTTWLQELVCVINCDCNFELVKSSNISDRSPFIEKLENLEGVNKLDSPRIIKTHLPIDCLPDNVENKSKVVYILRNPKDTAISFYHFRKLFKISDFKDDISDFIDKFKEGKVPYGPWWDHVNEYTARKNVHVIHYEDLKFNGKETIRALSKFLGKDFSEEKIEEIEKWCSFESMSKNPMTNYKWNERFNKEKDFFRKGKVGDWKNYFSSDQSEAYDSMIDNLEYKVKINCDDIHQTKE